MLGKEKNRALVAARSGAYFLERDFMKSGTMSDHLVGEPEAQTVMLGGGTIPSQDC